MFTGIITDIGSVKAFEKQGAVWRLVIETNFNTGDIDFGASVACNGVCLTVVSKDVGILEFDLSPETVNLTTYRDVKLGDKINMEKSLKLGDELGGHYVSGHVDGVAEVTSVEKAADNWVVKFSAPTELSKYIAKKGSVTINGTSLTVNKVQGNEFEINIIPHTLNNTNLSEIDAGKLVNLEVDIFARYIERINNQSE